MPIIAAETIHINVNEYKSIEVRLLEELEQNRCVNLPSFESTDIVSEQLHDVVKKLVGEKVIECTEDTCCISEKYFSFVDKLNGLRS